ncbi:hypothetical protein RKD20_002890 [Streptomyces sp. SLBN-8D4]
MVLLRSPLRQRNIARDRRLAKPAILRIIDSPPPPPARTSKGRIPDPSLTTSHDRPPVFTTRQPEQHLQDAVDPPQSVFPGHYARASRRRRALPGEGRSAPSWPSCATAGLRLPVCDCWQSRRHPTRTFAVAVREITPSGQHGPAARCPLRHQVRAGLPQPAGGWRVSRDTHAPRSCGCEAAGRARRPPFTPAPRGSTPTEPGAQPALLACPHAPDSLLVRLRGAPYTPTLARGSRDLRHGAWIDHCGERYGQGKQNRLFHSRGTYAGRRA